MELIEVPIGLTAVGGLKRGGKVVFCLKLANCRDKRRKSLFTSHQVYTGIIKENLVSISRRIILNHLNLHPIFEGVSSHSYKHWPKSRLFQKVSNA